MSSQFKFNGIVCIEYASSVENMKELDKIPDIKNIFIQKQILYLETIKTSLINYKSTNTDPDERPLNIIMMHDNYIIIGKISECSKSAKIMYRLIIINEYMTSDNNIISVSHEDRIIIDLIFMIKGDLLCNLNFLHRIKSDVLMYIMNFFVNDIFMSRFNDDEYRIFLNKYVDPFIDKLPKISINIRPFNIDVQTVKNNLIKHNNHDPTIKEIAFNISEIFEQRNYN